MSKVAPSVTKLRKKQGSKTARKGDLAPNPEMWAALGEGELLNVILEDFYTQVFSDAQLAPFLKIQRYSVQKKNSTYLQREFSLVKNAILARDHEMLIIGWLFLMSYLITVKS